MKILLYMVTRNEADRYLDSCLSCVKPLVDRMFVWDDQSDDFTADLAHSHGAYTAVRENEVPSFLEAEGAFRETGWNRMVAILDPEPGDWILTIDADEFVVGDIQRAATNAMRYEYSTVRLQIPEMFLRNPLCRRVDGFWGTIDGFRMTQYQPGDQSFRKHGMGCGTLPAYANKAWSAKEPQILHLGYADFKDRREKFERYMSIENSGHASSHVLSVVTSPSLVLWDGQTPDIWRGIRETTESSLLREL